MFALLTLIIVCSSLATLSAILVDLNTLAALVPVKSDPRRVRYSTLRSLLQHDPCQPECSSVFTGRSDNTRGGLGVDKGHRLFPQTGCYHRANARDIKAFLDSA
ncbi:hypothetical protein V8E55_005295 [Tylopilus felleus]